MTRFNEAIDESLTEATVRYSAILEHTREQFLAILGHDLRNPLCSIIMGANLLTQSPSIGDKDGRVAARILNRQVGVAALQPHGQHDGEEEDVPMR